MTPTPPLPEQLGSYRVLGLLGEGGSSRVYRVEQDAPRREVALKVLQPGAVASGFQHRFRREIALLGSLEHPGIARLYAAGDADTPHGPLPYLAMEYVRGSDLICHADQAQLSLVARVQLVIAICEAVQYAHLRGIVHRDLKPGNILVDEAGQVKVLDFGVAQVTSGDERTQVTRVGEVLGTLPYMSWEQLAGEPGALDPRADVFALGVIAYQLLSGRLPFPGGAETSLVQALRQRQDRRAPTLASLVPAARGDLDTVVMKAMSHEAAARYASAAEFAADLERYLDRRPIEARPPTAAYVARLFVRRHRAVAAGAALALIALLGAAVVSLRYGMAEASARRETEQRLAENTAITGFLEELLTSANPDQARGPQLTVRELLDFARTTLDSSALPPPVLRSLQGTIGNTYLHLGETTMALELLRRAEAAALRDEGESSFSHRRAVVDLANALNEFGQAPEAERQLNAALRSWPERPADSLTERTLRISLRKELAQALRNQGRTEVAIPSLESVLVDAERQLGAQHSETLSTLYLLANSYIAASRYDEAQRTGEQLITRRTASQGALHPATLDARMLIAQVLYGREDYRAAADHMQRLLADQMQVLGPDNVTTLLTRLNLGTVLASLQDASLLPEAAQQVRQALEGYRRRLEPGHNKIISALNTLSYLEQKQRHYAEAEAFLREGLRLTADSSAPGYDTNMSLRNNLGMLLIEQGRFEQALPELMQTVADTRRYLGEQHPDAAIYALNHAECLRRMGRFGEAVPLFERELAGLRKAFGAEHPRVKKGEARLVAARAGNRQPLA